MTLPAFLKHATHTPANSAPSAPGGATDREAFSRTLKLPDNGRAEVGALSRRWRGVDVFLSARDVGAAACVTIEVYAVIEGVRVLKRTGRWLGAFQSAIGGNAPIHVVALRDVQAERFEVALTYDDLPGADSIATVAVIGTDDALSIDDPTIGAIPMSGTGTLAASSTSRALVSPATLVGLHAVHANSLGADLFVQVHRSSVPAGGAVPLASFALPVGGSLLSWDPGLRALRFPSACSAVVSSTADTYTASADGRTVGWIR